MNFGIHLSKTVSKSMAALILAGWFALSAGAQAPDSRPPAPPKEDTFSEYLRKLEVTRTETWIQGEIRKFTTFRRLDRAYQLINANQLQEASAELGKYLKSDPDDIKVRATLMVVRYKMGDMAGVADEAALILKKSPNFVPALIYRGIAEQLLSHWDKAAASFNAAAAAPGIAVSDRIQALNMLADLLLRQKSFQPALESLRALGEIDKDTSVFLRQGMALESLHRGAEAMEAYRQAVQTKPAKPADRVLALGMLAEVAIRQGFYKDAVEPAREASKYDDSFGAWFRLGTVLEKTGSLTEAEKAFKKAASAAANSDGKIQAYRALSELAKRQKRWQDAVDADVEILRFRADDTDLLLELARLCQNANNYPEGLKWVRQAMKAKPSHAARELLATLLFAAKDYAGAAEEWKRLLKESAGKEDRRRTLIKLGNAYIAHGNTEAGYAALREAMNLRADAEVAETIGESLEQMLRYDEAITAYRHALELEPSPARHLRLGTLLSQRGDTAEAIQLLEKSLQGGELPVERSIAYKQLGFLYVRIGKDAEARKAFEAAIATGANDAETESALGQTCLKLKSYDEAVVHLRRAAAGGENLQILLAMAQAEAMAGNLEAAIETYRRALNSTADKSAPTSEILISIADLQERLGRHHEAAELYLEAYSQEGSASWKELVRAAESLSLAADWSKAAEVNSRLIAAPSLPGSELGAACERLGFAQARQGNNRQAAEAFTKALSLGRDRTELRLNLGYALLASGQRAEAIQHFLKSLETERPVRLLTTVGQFYSDSGKPGLAIFYFEEATRSIAALNPTEQRNLWVLLGQLYAGEKEFEKAVGAWGLAQRMGAKPSTELAMARMERLSGRHEESRARLEKIDMSALSNAEQADRWDELASIYRSGHDNEKSIEALRSANRLDPQASRFYVIGLDFANLGQDKAAIEAFEEAVAREPENVRHLESLGYAYRRAGRLEEAARLLEKVAQTDPDFLSVCEDLAYIKMQRSENKAAIGWFRKAIDNVPYKPVANFDEIEKLRVKTVRMRGEVATLSERFTAEFSLTPTFGNRQIESVQGGATGGVLPAQGSASVSYQPPRIGFRNGRILQVFNRVLWGMEPGSMRFQSDSFQGGTGVRYKPIRSQNLFVGAERLYKIGSYAENNWLLRSMYSWTCGFSPDADGCTRNYTTVYVDAAYFAQNRQRGAVFGEARQGITLTPHSRLRLTPHLVADIRHENPGPVTGSYAEAGGGISAKYFPPGSRHERSRRAFEVIIHYRVGRFLKDSAAPSADKLFGGWIINTIIQF
jgi:bacteriophage N4 adsorption protein A